MPEHADLARPIMGAATGLQGDRAGGGWAAKNGRTWLRRSLLRNTTAPEASAPWTWKMLFARSKPIVLTCPMDASLEWCSTPPLWHTKAVGGRPPHQGPLALAARGCHPSS